MRRFSLTTLILFGLAGGILLGIFIGERAKILDPVGEGFIRLLQMAVLPYFIVALPLGFGRLTYEEARLTGFRLALFSMLLWALGFLLVMSLPFAFPMLESASFFSNASVEPPREINFVELYIPANPFSSLSDAVIPGVVVFGMALGIALIGVPQKRELLTVLDSLANALGRVTAFVVRLTPIGVFALSASAAGSMTLADLSRLQVYLVAYTLGTMLLTFWLVPMLVSSLTPFSYREVLKATRDPLVTGFTTGNLLVVLAMLAENCKQLFQERDQTSRHADSVIDVTLPIAFTFPNLGVVMLLLFVPFASWFVGTPLDFADYPKLCLLGFFSFFGSVEIGLPFLLQQMEIPTDLFQLHVVTLVYIGRLATLLAVMHLAAVSLLCAAGNAGWLKLRPRRLATFATSSAAILAGSIACVAMLLNSTVDRAYTKDKVIAGMQAIRYELNGSVKHELPPQRETGQGQSTLERIRATGTLRVGYDPDGLPFSFFNAAGKLVGLDIELTQALADDIGVHIEYYPYQKANMDIALNDEQRYDILVGGLFATPQRVEKMRFSEPYLDLHLAMIMLDHRKVEFSTLKALKETKEVKVGVLERPYFGEKIAKAAPQVSIVTVASPREFFEGESDLDILIMSAEAGSAWTLLYPRYTVVTPKDAPLTVSVGFPMALEAIRLENVLSRWIDLKKKDGTMQALYEHWIEGKTAEAKTPRWNVLMSVLGEN